MTWFVYLVSVLAASFLLALTGCLGKTAKRASRNASRKVWRGFKGYTSARWQERRQQSRGKPKKTRRLKVLKSQPVIYRVAEKRYEPTTPPCGGDTDKGTPCKRERTVLKNGVILGHCWQHPSKAKK